MLISRILDIRDAGSSIKVYAQAVLGDRLINRFDTIINGEPCQEFTFIVSVDDNLNKFSEKVLYYINMEFSKILSDKEQSTKRSEILRDLKKTLVGTITEIKDVDNISKL